MDLEGPAPRAAARDDVAAFYAGSHDGVDPRRIDLAGTKAVAARVLRTRLTEDDRVL